MLKPVEFRRLLVAFFLAPFAPVVLLLPLLALDLVFGTSLWVDYTLFCIMALVTGFVPYIVFGLPVIFLYARKAPITYYRASKAAFISTLILVFALIIVEYTNSQALGLRNITIILGAFSFLFSQIWALAVVFIYRRLINLGPRIASTGR